MSSVLPFSYNLQPERIAQRPCHPAHAAKLLALDRSTAQVTLSSFFELPKFLKPNDLLIFNDSRVIPARLFGKRGDLEVELLLLKALGEGRWECIGRPLRKLKPHDQIIFSDHLVARFLSRTQEDGALVEFYYDGELAQKERVLEVGLMPIPPYIREGKSDAQDSIDYQTQFAKIDGSIAAPTASLHFSEELILKIRDLGCNISFLTLHVGLSSIREVEANSLPGAERFCVSASLSNQITTTKQAGGRIVAVGTTVVRALESYARDGLLEQERDTSLFIRPGFEFNLVDVLVTNFHMPGSTHLLLVEAFLRHKELLETCYSYALQNDFRFLSYGDGMIIL